MRVKQAQLCVQSVNQPNQTKKKTTASLWHQSKQKFIASDHIMAFESLLLDDCGISAHMIRLLCLECYNDDNKSTDYKQNKYFTVSYHRSLIITHLYIQIKTCVSSFIQTHSNQSNECDIFFYFSAIQHQTICVCFFVSLQTSLV